MSQPVRQINVAEAKSCGDSYAWIGGRILLSPDIYYITLHQHVAIWMRCNRKGRPIQFERPSASWIAERLPSHGVMLVAIDGARGVVETMVKHDAVGTGQAAAVRGAHRHVGKAALRRRPAKALRRLHKCESISWSPTEVFSKVAGGRRSLADSRGERPVARLWLAVPPRARLQSWRRLGKRD